MEAYNIAREYLNRNEGDRLLPPRTLQRKLVREADVRLSLAQATQLLKEVAPQEQAVRDDSRVPRRKKGFYRITAPPYSFQIDVIFFKTDKKANDGHDRMLVIIDILSRKAWAYPMKSNKMAEILTRFKQFQAHISPVVPVMVQGDKEFAAGEFATHCKAKGIVLRTNVAKDDHIAGGDALGIIDRFSRTIRTLISSKMRASADLQWTGFLPDLLRTYNTNPHTAHNSAGGLSPNDVWADFDELLAKRLDDLLFNWERKNGRAEAEAFAVGDWVRVIMPRKQFQKGGVRLQRGKYRIVETKGLDRYILVDDDDERQRRAYKGAELVKTTAPDPAGDAEPSGNAAVEKAERAHANTLRFKRTSNLPQEPTPEAELRVPRQTRLATGAIKRTRFTR